MYTVPHVRLEAGCDVSGVIVVNLNPCIDWQYSVPGFVFGGLNRVNVVRRDIAGKGINVCIALKNLGLDPICTGFNFSENGHLLTDALGKRAIRHDFVEVEGAVRVNIKLYEEFTGTMTELNQPGGFVNACNQEKLRVGQLLSKTSKFQILVVSGSRPAGVEPDFYAKLCKNWDGKVILDTDGEALKLAIETAPPFAIKPNLFELESTFGVSLDANKPKEIAEFCRESIIGKGVGMVCVSMGADGAVLVTADEFYCSPAMQVEQVKGVQGAGDAMVAGMVYGICKNASPKKILQYALSAAAASVMRDGTEMCSREDFDKML